MGHETPRKINGRSGDSHSTPEIIDLETFRYSGKRPISSFPMKRTETLRSSVSFPKLSPPQNVKETTLKKESLQTQITPRSFVKSVLTLKQ